MAAWNMVKILESLVEPEPEPLFIDGYVNANHPIGQLSCKIDALGREIHDLLQSHSVIEKKAVLVDVLNDLSVEIEGEDE